MTVQDFDCDRVLIVQFGRCRAAYVYDSAIDRWMPASENVPPGFPESIEANHLMDWEPVWSE